MKRIHSFQFDNVSAVSNPVAAGMVQGHYAFH